MKEHLNITIAGLDEVETLVGTPFTKVISISDANLAEEGGYERPIKAYFPKARTYFSYFDDVEYQTENGPQEAEIRQLLDFSRPFKLEDNILIHCRAGISRSTAIAYAIICQHSPPGQEALAYAYLCQLRPQLHPNRLTIKIADAILKRKGKMITGSATRFGESF